MSCLFFYRGSETRPSTLVKRGGPLLSQTEASGVGGSPIDVFVTSHASPDEIILPGVLRNAQRRPII